MEGPEKKRMRKNMANRSEGERKRKAKRGKKKLSVCESNVSIGKGRERTGIQ